MSEFYDCHGGPGTTADACGACVTCLHRVIEGLERERDAVKARVERMECAGDRLFEELDDKTPEPNCRCHVFPPCADCTSHASSREALKEWKEANK